VAVHAGADPLGDGSVRGVRGEPGRFRLETLRVHATGYQLLLFYP